MRERKRGRERPIWTGFDDGRRIRSALKVGKLKFSVSKDGGAGKRRKGLPPNVPRPRRCKLREREGQVYAAEAGRERAAERSSGAGCSRDQA